MDCYNLSSTGLQDIDANDVIADNITILSNLNVSGTTYLFNFKRSGCSYLKFYQ